MDNVTSGIFGIPQLGYGPFYPQNQQNVTVHSPQGQPPEPPSPYEQSQQNFASHSHLGPPPVESDYEVEHHHGQNQQNVTGYNHPGQPLGPPLVASEHYYWQNHQHYGQNHHYGYGQNQQNLPVHSPQGRSPEPPSGTIAHFHWQNQQNFIGHSPQGVGQAPLHNGQEELQLLERQVTQQVWDLQQGLINAQAAYQESLFNISQQQQGLLIQVPIFTLYPQDQARQLAARKKERCRVKIRRGEGEREEVCRHHARGLCKFGSWCKFSHPNILGQVKSISQEYAQQSYVQAEQGNRTPQNLSDDDTEDSSLTRAPITLEPIAKGWKVERFLSSMEADTEVYTGDDIGFPSVIGTLPYRIKVVPKDHPGVQNLFFVPYYDLKRPNEEPYISLENLGQVGRIPGQSRRFQEEKISGYLEKKLGRAPDIKLGGILSDLPSTVIVGLVQFVTGIPIKAIDVFKRVLGSSSPGLCTIWIDYDAIDYSALNLSGDEANLEETVKWAVISAFTDNTVWMASITEANGVFIARDDGSKAYLCNLLNDRRRHGLEKTHYPRHPMTAARWETLEERGVLQRRKPCAKASSVAGGGAAATPAVAGGGAAASSVGGRSAP